MHRIPFVFVVPDPGATVSGGHRYNRRLMDELGRLYAPTLRVGWREYRERVSRGAEGCCFVDTLYLARLGELPEGPIQAHLIVHHLESLWPDGERTSDEVFFREEQAALRRFQGFLVTSEFSKDYLVGRGFAAEQVVVIEPGVEGFGPPTRGRASQVRALMVANLVRRKNVLGLLKSLPHRIRGSDRFHLRVVGGHELEPEYARACASYSAESFAEWVTLTGSLSPAEMSAEYAAADLFLSPAHMETFGMALQEAVASGCPILALDRGNVSAHVRPGQNGLLFPDLEALAVGLRRLLDNPEELARLQRSAAQIASGAGRPWLAAAEQFLRSYG